MEQLTALYGDKAMTLLRNIRWHNTVVFDSKSECKVDYDTKLYSLIDSAISD